MPRYNDAEKAQIYLNRTACKQIRLMPTADVAEVKHGEYITKGAWHIECSVCGHILAHIGEAKNYCPYCGAKMDKKESEGFSDV